MSKLNFLFLNRTDVDRLDFIKELPNLGSLQLSHTKVSDAALTNLDRATGLWALLLDGTAVRDPGSVNLKGLRMLEQLDLSRTQITDAGLEQLKGLTKMQMLKLAETHVGDARAGPSHQFEETLYPVPYKDPNNRSWAGKATGNAGPFRPGAR